MTWLAEAIETVAARPICGYRQEGEAAVEPTALAALALAKAGRGSRAAPALDWLADAQAADGSLGVDLKRRQPCWPTGWAIAAWKLAAVGTPHGEAKWSAAAQRAADWLLTVSGRPLGRETASDNQRFFGHDITLQGWPWVEGTHSWVEPTAVNLLALRVAARATHPRCREAVKLLLDRQLPQGGWNYGNTTVFGHLLRPQVQPTGLALAALAGEANTRGGVARSLDWLARALDDRTAAGSLSYALIGLAAHGLRPRQADRWLQSAYNRVAARGGSPYHIALLVAAALWHK